KRIARRTGRKRAPIWAVVLAATLLAAGFGRRGAEEAVTTSATVIGPLQLQKAPQRRTRPWRRESGANSSLKPEFAVWQGKYREFHRIEASKRVNCSKNIM